MEQLDRVKICKRCSNRMFDINKGVLCSLSGTEANFQVECSDYIEDKDAIVKEDKLDASKEKYYLESDQAKLDTIREKKPKLAVKSGATWFYWIAGLSLINSLVLLVKGNFGFFVGLGITQLIDGVIIGSEGDIA